MKKDELSHSATWHRTHEVSLSWGERVADAVANSMGSWTFIIIQSVLIVIWMALNIMAYLGHWDPYPFILLNLVFSTQAAYAAPIIMMAQNRQNNRDRHQAMADFETNLRAKKEIEKLQRDLARIESEKLDKILALLEAKK